MNFSNLFSKAKKLASNENAKAVIKKITSSDTAKKVVKKAANSKKVKEATEKISKLTKAVGIDANTVISYALKNKSVMDVLIKLGLKKESDPASSAVQKLVGSLKSSINKASGAKLENKIFGSAVTKLLGVDKIKTQLEKTAGKGVSTFIKKAVSEYIS